MEAVDAVTPQRWDQFHPMEENVAAGRVEAISARGSADHTEALVVRFKGSETPGTLGEIWSKRGLEPHAKCGVFLQDLAGSFRGSS